MKARVLVLAAYPFEAAATRFRIGPVLRELSRRGIDSVVRTFLSSDEFRAFYASGFARTQATTKGTMRQLFAALETCDAVLVQREATLVGPALPEALLHLRRKPVFLDFDDAIWLSGATSQGLARWARDAVRYPSKFWSVARSATHLFAGSESLAATARRVNSQVSVVPSVVSREVWHPTKDKLSGELPEIPVVGWIGTHSTAPQLSLAAAALARLRAEGFRFRVRVVGGADYRIPGIDAEYVPWTLERDVVDFQELDVGLAPMFSDPWCEGKCAFKQVQYMAVGVPCVSSMVGGARDFVVHEENALVASDEASWYSCIRRLLTDRALREGLARSGRSLVETRLCSEVQSVVVADVIESALARRGH